MLRALVARRVDEILATLHAPTPERIEALASYAEDEAAHDPDRKRAAMGRAFAAELRARVQESRRPSA